MGFEPGGSLLWAVRKDRALVLFAMGEAGPRPVPSSANGYRVDVVSEAGDLALVRDPSGLAHLFAIGRPDRPPHPLVGLDHAVKYVQTSRDLSLMVAAASKPSKPILLEPLVNETDLSRPTEPSPVSIWDLAQEPARRLTLRSEIGPIFAARVTRDGRWLLAAGERGNAVRDGSATPPTERRYPPGAFFSFFGEIPESRDFQVASGQGQLFLVNLTDPTAAPLALATDVDEFAVDPAGDRVATLAPSGELRVYRLRAAGRSMSEQLRPLLDESEAVLGRNLTELEWTQYLPHTPYAKTFPRLPGPYDWDIPSGTPDAPRSD
jgi:hypothetical protein